MKKALLLGISCILSGAVFAQDFTTQGGDSIMVAIGSDSSEIHNDIVSIIITPVKITWKVKATNMTGTWAAENVVGLCDNDSCYMNDKNGTLLKGATHTSGDYPPGVPDDFYLKLTNMKSVAAGTAYVTVNLSDGTQSTDITFIVEKFPSGITSVSKLEDEVIIYPNPANNDVHVVFDQKKKIQHITAYNLIGKVVKTYNVNGSGAQLDMTDMPAGTYLLKLYNAQGQTVATRRLVHQ